MNTTTKISTKDINEIEEATFSIYFVNQSDEEARFLKFDKLDDAIEMLQNMFKFLQTNLKLYVNDKYGNPTYVLSLMQFMGVRLDPKFEYNKKDKSKDNTYVKIKL